MEQKIKDVKHFIAIIDERIEALVAEQNEPMRGEGDKRFLRSQIASLKSYRRGALYVLEIMEED